MWAGIQFLSRSARIAAYSSRAARYSWLRWVRPLAAWAAVLPWGLTSLSTSVTVTSLSILISESLDLTLDARSRSITLWLRASGDVPKPLRHPAPVRSLAGRILASCPVHWRRRAQPRRHDDGSGDGIPSKRRRQ